jgi:hypothetical protein
MLKIIGGGTIGKVGVYLKFPDWPIEINALPNYVIKVGRRHIGRGDIISATMFLSQRHTLRHPSLVIHRSSSVIRHSTFTIRHSLQHILIVGYFIKHTFSKGAKR